MKKRYCDVPDCNEIHHARGWCVAHYARWRIGDVEADIPIGPPGRRPGKWAGQITCTKPGCDGKHIARGMCWRHYQADRRERLRNA